MSHIQRAKNEEPAHVALNEAAVVALKVAHAGRWAGASASVGKDRRTARKIDRTGLGEQF